MDDSAIFKVWGERRRILLTDKCEIDLLYLKKNTFCSTHRHKTKINRFYVVSGQVRIETEFGTVVLLKDNCWEVRTPVKHRFYVVEDSVMIEMSYVEKGKIDPKDIQRERQGGQKIGDIEYTEDELKEKGMLGL